MTDYPQSAPNPDEVRTASDMPLPGGEFRLFVTRLAIQGMLALGLVENPLTGEKAQNPPGARMIIEDLKMILEKTRGNLEPGEQQHLEQVLADLTAAYANLEEADSST